MDTLHNTSRFLMQATLGVNYATIKQVAETGIETWLEKQLSKAAYHSNLFESSTRRIWQHFRKDLVNRYGESAINGEGNNPALPYKWYFHMAWWQHCLTSEDDLLRQRITQALSEVLVISDNSALELDAIGMASFYDLLYNHAFGSYADLLYQVSIHPCMGVYLSHMNNRKADPSHNIHPDENYAREVMQLFSIGLFELNMDGSHKTDRNGNSVPTYDNNDIKQLARVFTGLQAHSYQYEWSTSFWDASYNGYSVSFEDGIDKTYKTVPFVNMTRPMVVDENYHDRQPKQLLKGWIQLPANQNGEQEIRSTINALVAHPSTAPFIARHLINQLVTSNPSPAYIRAVAAKFGPRGDLKAVIREILSWPLKHPVSTLEFASAYPASSYSASPDKSSGDQRVQSQKLKSPLLRTTQLLRAFNVQNRSGRYWLIGDDIQQQLQQHPLSSPTVFNFYKPDFVPHGPLERRGLVAPEFELMTSATGIGYVNMLYYWFFGDYYPAVSTQISAEAGVYNVPELDPDRLITNSEDKLSADFSTELALARAERHDELIDHMSLLLTGKTELPIKTQIKHAFRNYADNPLWVVQTVAFMLAISAEFTVQEA
ncbi:MAG: DUF1800 domain-containing protein [Marinobacterium sp.]|nr:DUF1800 domain-containing protein [Marinobacterium sp.]